MPQVFLMEGGRVALMDLKSVLGPLFCRIVHIPVPGFLGQDRGCHDLGDFCVSFDDCLAGNVGNLGGNPVAINQHQLYISQFLYFPQSPGHRQHGRLQDIVCVDFLGGRPGDSPHRLFLDDCFGLFPLSVGQLLRVVEHNDGKIVRQQHTGGANWSGQRAAASFINSCDAIQW